jgi:Isochorismatase family
MRRRISNSPLIDPTVCAVITMAPAAHDLLSISHDLPAPIIRPTPRSPKPRAPSTCPSSPCFGVPLALAGEPSHASPRQFLLEEYQCPWLNRAFVEALSSEAPSVLLVGGFWLEHEILGTALHALAACYEVAILADITPPRQAPAARAASERLVQAGATPIVTSQLIREWMVAAPAGPKREALRALLPVATAA